MIIGDKNDSLAQRMDHAWMPTFLILWIPPSCHPRRPAFLHSILILLLSSHEGTWKEDKEELVKLMSI